jgi:hypothetical protein
VLVCRTDKRSATAARTLRAAGFTQVNVLRRGMEQWNETGLPVEARAAESTATATAAKGMVFQGSFTMAGIMMLDHQRSSRLGLLPLPPNSGLPEFGTLSPPKSDKSDFGWERGGVRG